MIDTFATYLNLGKVKKKTPDPEEANALLMKAQRRIQNMRPLTTTSADLVLEDAYEALREAAQALMSIKGYKPYSHEATISFLKEHYSASFSESTIMQFDFFRDLRNKSVYSAITINTPDAAHCVSFAKTIIQTIKKLVQQ